jgi:hypothetical protein
MTAYARSTPQPTRSKDVTPMKDSGTLVAELRDSARELGDLADNAKQSGFLADHAVLTRGCRATNLAIEALSRAPAKGEREAGSWLIEPPEAALASADEALMALYQGDGGWIGEEAAREQTMIVVRALRDGLSSPTEGRMREQIARVADVLLNAGCGDSDECERIARQALNHEEQSDV